MITRRRKYIYNCVICNKKFHPSRKEYTSCSKHCGAILRKRRGGKTGYNKQKVNCSFCKKEFLVQSKKINNKNLYCSLTCYWLSKKENMKQDKNSNYKNAIKKIICPTCGKEFLTYHKKVKYCSQKCCKHINLYQKGVRYERQAKKELEQEGYIVTRSSGSHGKADLIAINKEKIRLIQVKSTLNLITSLESLQEKDIIGLKILEVPFNTTKELWLWRIRKGWEKKIIS